MCGSKRGEESHSTELGHREWKAVFRARGMIKFILQWNLIVHPQVEEVDQQL